MTRQASTGVWRFQRDSKAAFVAGSEFFTPLRARGVKPARW